MISPTATSPGAENVWARHRERRNRVAISSARVAAFHILLRVETADAYAAELLHSDQTAKLSALDRNLAMQIVMGVLRWQSRLDAEVGHFATGKHAVGKLDAEV